MGEELFVAFGQSPLLPCTLESGNPCRPHFSASFAALVLVLEGEAVVGHVGNVGYVGNVGNVGNVGIGNVGDVGNVGNNIWLIDVVNWKKLRIEVDITNLRYRMIGLL